MSETLDELASILQQIEQLQGGTYIESADGYREVKRLFAKAGECVEKLRDEALPRKKLAQKILKIVEQARWNMEIHKIDVLLIDAPYTPEPALDEIYTLCRDALGIPVAQTCAQSTQKQEPITFESIMKCVDEIREKTHMEMLPHPELRANSKTIGIIGDTSAACTTKVKYPYTLLTPGTLYGMTIDVDETVPDGEVRPAYPAPSFPLTVDWKHGERET